MTTLKDCIFNGGICGKRFVTLHGDSFYEIKDIYATEDDRIIGNFQYDSNPLLVRQYIGWHLNDLLVEETRTSQNSQDNSGGSQ